MLGGKPVHKALVLPLLFLFSVARFLECRDRSVGLVLRSNRHLRKPLGEPANKFFYDQVFPVRATVGAKGHPHDKNVHFIFLDQFRKAFHQIRLFLVDGFPGKCPLEFGIGKSNPDPMFSVIDA